MRKWLTAHRNAIFHTLYGAPAATALLLDQVKVIDLSPLITRFVGADAVPAIMTGIAVMSLVLHFTDARIKGDPQ
jgi:hypothetical protein